MAIGSAAVGGIDRIHITIKQLGPAIDFGSIGRVWRIQLRSDREGAAA
jgi:hypothetical protein